MNMSGKTEPKKILWVMLISSLTGISYWYLKRLIAAPASDWFSETVVMFSYFTNLTNLLIVIMAAALLAGRGRLYNWFKFPAVQAACCLYIAFVGIGFWFILGGPTYVQSVWDWIPEVTAHTLSPILGIVYFYFGVPDGELTWKHPFIWLAYPIGYLIYWLIRGPIVGYYPYFFVDVNLLGYGGVAIWSGALIVVFLILGTIMWRVDRWQASRQVQLSATN